MEFSAKIIRTIPCWRLGPTDALESNRINRPTGNRPNMRLLDSKQSQCIAAMCLGQKADVCEYIRVLGSETAERYVRLTQPTDRIGAISFSVSAIIKQ